MKKAMMIATVMTLSLQQLYADTPAAQLASSPHHSGHHHVDVVVIDLQHIGQGLIEFQELAKNIQDKMKKLVEKIQELERKIQEATNELKAKGRMLTPEALERKQIEIAKMKSEYEIQAQGLEAKAQQEMVVVNEKLMLKVQEFAKKMGWKIVIPMAVYVAPEYDKTQFVIDALNKEYMAKNKKGAEKQTNKNTDEE